MSTITQTIAAYTGDLPDKDTMTPDEFDVAAEAFVTYITAMSPEINTWATQANAVGVSANDLVTALGAANFKGNWSDQTGLAALPYCVLHDSNYWMLLTPLVFVPDSEPSASNTDWALYAAWPATIAKTADFTVTEAELRGNVTITNLGAIAAVNLSLPAVDSAYRLCVYVAAAQYLRMTANGTEKFRFGTDQSAAGGYIRSNVIGTYYELSGAPGTEWAVTKIVGYVDVDE